MSEPRILADLVHEWASIRDHLHHHAYPGPEPASTTPDTKGSTRMSSILSDIHKAVDEGITNLEGWAGDVKEHLPQLAALAAKYENSPIVQALESAVLPPAVEASIADMINKFAAEFPVTPAAPAATGDPSQAPDGGTPAVTAPAAG